MKDYNPKKFNVPLATGPRFVQSAIVCGKTRPLMDLSGLLGIRILIANSCMRRPGMFKGLSQDGGRNDFSTNLRASPFNYTVISIDAIFSQIHLAGQ